MKTTIKCKRGGRLVIVVVEGSRKDLGERVAGGRPMMARGEHIICLLLYST